MASYACPAPAGVISDLAPSTSIGDARVVTRPERAPIDVRIEQTPAAAWILAHRRELVEAALVTLRESTVGDDIERESQLSWIMDYNVRLFVRVFGGESVLDESAASELVASAALRASEGFPVENLLETYVGGTAAIWRLIASRVRPDELADLIVITGELFDYLRGVMALVVRGFEREASRVRLGERDARYAVYSALLSGADLEHAAARAGVPIAARYLVVAIHLARDHSPDSSTPYLSAARRGNALLSMFDELASGEVLAVVGDPHATALIPVDPTAQPGEIQRVRTAVDRLVQVLGAPVHAAASFAPAQDVPAAATRAEEILELALATDLPAGAWFLDDVLLPYQLTRPGPAFDLLRHRLAVLDAHPDWESTLQAASKHGWDRTRTARELHVHPNTVDYRLRRMADATGLDAGDPAQRALVLAAMYIRAVDRRSHVADL